MKGKKSKIDPALVEETTQQIGRSLWNQRQRRNPSIFEKRWWDDRIMSWAMLDESVKVQMFRFVDVLPMLKSHESVNRHLHEYFEEVRSHLPWAVRIGLDVTEPDTILSRSLAINARSNALRMAKRFIAGESVAEVHSAISGLRRQGMAFTLDLLGEAVINEEEAERYLASYLNLLSGLAPLVGDWAENIILDRDDRGPIPRLNASIKLSALVSHFNPHDPTGTATEVKQRLRPILTAARELDAYIHVDMENYAVKDLTIEIFQQILMEPDFRDFHDVGIVIQAYQPEAEQDLIRLRDWAKKRGTPIWIRLVKGAYWDYETVIAAQRGWPVPVYLQKWESDANYERLTEFLLRNSDWLRPAFASHNLRSLSHALAWAKILGLPKNAFELQMLYGMAGDQAELFAESGHRIRIYTPFGELIPGMAYLVRRLLENTSNDSFLRASLRTGVDLDSLLMNPMEIGNMKPAPAPIEHTGFQNEPWTDFSRAENREAMQEALEDVQNELGEEYAIVIQNRRIDTKKKITSRNPSNKKEIVGKVSSAGKSEALQAIEAARSAFREWSTTEVNYRAEYLELIAAELRRRKFELAAWEVLECGKPWLEADADVAEAIDFCMYYAHEMRRLDHPRQVHLPGEENDYFYQPRGVAVVIAPWNFPLAILCGMTVAPLVAGNTVIMKPAEQSSVVAAKFMQVLQDVELPPGVANFLPGIGEEIGPLLVEHPDVDLIAFTGSQGVGLSINKTASEARPDQNHVKRVIAEMGGKNAIIIDEDADLDEAVQGVLSSAFGYAGQKCSACSRVIALKPVYDDFLRRLVAGAKSLKVGPADDPGVNLGPVIDEEARNKILDFIELGKEEGELALAAELPDDLSSKGYFIGPHIFTEIPPDGRLAQEEIFGPVLTVFPARNLDEAFEIANSTRYALTGGMYSRSPVNLKRARKEFRVGNLYLNRGITGALVERQPFGGFRMSGIGSKAGGPDYLLQFLIPINVTENTMRRGFAPQTDPDEPT